MSEFTFEKNSPGKYRPVPAYPETPGVNATGTADPHSAFHVPVETELAAICNPLFCKVLQHPVHHPLRTAYADRVVTGDIDSIHEFDDISPVSGGAVIRCDLQCTGSGKFMGEEKVT
jgi:hypothetical protein